MDKLLTHSGDTTYHKENMNVVLLRDNHVINEHHRAELPKLVISTLAMCNMTLGLA